MSIHLVGKNYGGVPEGSRESIPEIQTELAIERGNQGGFSRVIWIPRGLQVEDNRQQKFIEHLRMDPRIQTGFDLLETPVEELRTVIQDRLKRPLEPVRKESGSSTSNQDPIQVYLMYDQRDIGVASPWADLFFDRGFEVIRPVFDGDEREVREYHEENLRICDGALIFYGAASELWVRGNYVNFRKARAMAGSSRFEPSASLWLHRPRRRRNFEPTKRCYSSAGRLRTRCLAALYCQLQARIGGGESTV